MKHTNTEQPSDQFMQLWQAYCDKKSECDDLRERIAELEASQARVPLSESDCEEIFWDWVNGSCSEIDLIRAIEAAHGITQEKQG